MATQYTSILKLALPVQGELSGTWGDVVNDNITSMVEEAIAGRAVINTWTANSHTLTTADGTTSESRAAILTLTDTGTALTGAGIVICPAASKIYIVENGTGQTITVKTASGTGAAVPDGKNMVVFCDGTNVEEGITNINSLTLNGDGATVSSIKDEDNMASDSATALATQQSIKAYVDSQVGANNELSEVLANGNTTGGTDIAVGTGDDITFADSSKAIFGAGSDLQIYHDGSHSYVKDAGTGILYVQGSGQVRVGGADGTTGVEVNEGGDVKLRYNNANKLATTSTGIDVTGTAVTDGLTVAGTAQFDDYGGTTGKGRIQFGNSGQQFIEGLDTGNGGSGAYLRFGYGSTETARFDNSGNFGIGTSSPQAELHVSNGSAGFEFKPDGISDGNSYMQVYDRVAGSYDTLRYYAAEHYFHINNDEKMRIDSSGNVGIGTSNTTFVNGVGLKIANATAARLILTDSTNGVGSEDGLQFTQSGTNAYFNLHENGFMAFNTNNTEAMRIDSSGNVGIGTSAMSSYNTNWNDLVIDGGTSSGLTVVSATTGIGTLAFADGTTGNEQYRSYLQYSHNNDELSIGVAGALAATIDSNGNLLVGTTTYNSANQGILLGATGVIYSTGTSGISASFGRNTTDGSIVNFRKDNSTVGSISSVAGTDLSITSDDGVLYLGGDLNGSVRAINNIGSGQPRLDARTDATTDLGATSNRFKDLYLSGATKLFSGTNSPATDSTLGDIDFGARTDGTVTAKIRGIAGNNGNGTDGQITFFTADNTASQAAQERMRLDSSGNLLVGTTSGSPTTKVNITQTANNLAAYVFASASSGYNATVFAVQGNQSSSNESYILADFVNGNASGRTLIYDSGDIDNTNGAYGSLSDVKLKTDITDASSQWEDIKAIRFRKYKMIADPEQRVQMGVIAQELEEAGMSGLVRETNDKDMQGNDLGTTTKSVKYSILYTKAVKALQEAMDRIETLEARITALESN